ncbi:MAG: Hsp33 family molecular chaperone HslO [Comamonas sp.]|nr:Hsp33 family molecular chaperone HslO [Comamonas sp.]
MSELHKFLFDGLPVRGMVVRLTDAWQAILQRRAANTETGAYPAAVRELLGEMTAAAVLMQSNIKFNGALVFQIFGDGPVKVAVAEVQSNLALRATASVSGAVEDGQSLASLVNAHGQGRCAITLDPQERQPGQQPYQGVVPLQSSEGGSLQTLAQALQHYMHQSEQLDTTLVLAANDQVAAGLLIQRMPLKGQDNLAGATESADDGQDALGGNEDYQRIATLAASLQREELLSLDVDTILRRLFWEEKLLRFVPQTGANGPHFACTCSRERVQTMLRGLGQEEVAGVVAERGSVEVGCDYCGTQYRFDPIDITQLFTDTSHSAPGSVQ